MGNTKIEWCDTVWNVVTGCTKVSPGCSRCYAEGLAKRFWKGRPFEDVRFHEDRMFQPLHWTRPRRVFVNSMSDLFHEDLAGHQLLSIFDVMARAHWHTFQVLTKRADRMRCFMKILPPGHIPPNVWLGVSVENQAMADERIPILLDTPAAVRFLSVEPLLGPVDLIPWIESYGGLPRASTIDWVIVGGESGRQARQCNVKWVLDIVEQCRDSSVPCFVKQLGAKPVYDGEKNDPWLAFESSDGTRQLGLRDSKGGNWSEWPDHLRVRQFPKEQAHA